MSIGKKLLELRQRRRLSQEYLANKLRVSRQTISDLYPSFYQVSIIE